MALTWQERVAALLGVSAYTQPQGYGLGLDDPTVKRIRKSLGGQISGLPTTKLRWLLSDLEAARANADTGDLSRPAQLYRAMRGDGDLAGFLDARSSSFISLPRRFAGNPEIVRALDGRGGVRSVFDEMFPPSELKLMDEDGFVLGVSVGELVPVEGRDYPVLVRLEPEYLRFRWNENRWYYLSLAGPLPITPGDGRWLLHTPAGRLSPWQFGKWPGLGRAWINKEHALLYEANWQAKLANPARVATSPQGASEEQAQSWFRAVMAWGVNTVFGMKPGYDVKLLESNGRGYESFGQTIERSNTAYKNAINGQVVTADGGAGFSNADVPERVRDGLIKADAEGIAYTINTQGIPPFVVERWGVEALNESAIVEWEIAEARSLGQEAEALSAAAAAIVALGSALKAYNKPLDIIEITNRFNIPIRGDVDGDGIPDAEEGLAIVDEETPVDVELPDAANDAEAV